MEYYSTFQKRKFCHNKKTQMKLVDMILNEITYLQKNKIFHDFILWMWYHSSSP